MARVKSVGLVHVGDMPGAGQFDVARAGQRRRCSLRMAAGVTPSFSPAMNRTGRFTVATAEA